MKVVGHAQIIMTLHYTKIKHLDIVETLDAGEKRLLARSQDQKNALLMEDRIHNHKDELLIPVYSALHDPEWPKASIKFFDYGLCPYGSTRCSDGGLEREETKNSKTKTEYNPVHSGYLGCQNCFRCRHFVTGAPFVVGLIIKGNEISEAKQYVSNKMLDINAEIEALDEEIFLLEDSSKIVPPDVKMKQKRLNNLLESEQIRLDMLSCDFLSIFRLVDQSLQLLNKVASIDSKIPMIMNAPKLSISISEVSKHRALAEVCENAEIFLSANATTALPRRSQSLDKMLSNNNMQPQLFKLSEKMQLHVGNQITQLMLARLNGWGNINRVLDGELPLDLLGNSDDSDLVPLSLDIKALLENSITLEIKTDELI
ncbi:MAG: hypothetical protein GW890_00075 [Vibrio sp.]|nr:hypothetical protein [Vibrio sp.]